MNKKEIAEFAETKVREYNPEGISPFPFEKIQKDHTDLQIVYTHELDERISGATVFNKEASKFLIFINTNKPKTRQNFTVAHELGHYFLHQDMIKDELAIIDDDSTLESNRVLFRLDIETASRIETEANNFAASLIMPSELVKKTWEAFGDVEKCADLFNVSVSAMSIRLEKLSLLTQT